MTASEPGPIVVFLIELRRLQCGRGVGTLEARQWPWHGPALIRLSGARQAVPVADWSRLRCTGCAGNVYADDVTTTRRYPPVFWNGVDAPRRGRPPRWLVAKRQVARDADDDWPAASPAAPDE